MQEVFVGRRPLPIKQARLEVNPQNPEVQSKVDDLAVLLLDKIRAEMEKPERGEAFSELTLKELTKELRGLLQAIKRPATSLNLVQIPQAGQPRQVQGAQDRILESPESRRKHREALEQQVLREEYRS